ncbi:hypothetical protein [Synechococcus sp. O70.2]|uniref:hypothetical protein n=1 Tax=Synechococcus sp. O70.2 TaxID=2964533 RepID=UPI0039C4709F
MVWRRRSILQFGVIACAMLLALAVGGVGSLAQAQRPLEELPQPVRLKLPPGLARYAYDKSAGDYFEEIEPLLPGGAYAQWAFYPIPVYIQGDHPQWKAFVEQAVKEWSAYIPLKVVAKEEEAFYGMSIYRVPPIGEGIAGAARPEFFFAADGSLQQRVRIVIAEGRGLAEVTAVARHEIGHGLGLWGHSPNPRDLMYGGHHAKATGNRRLLRVPTITKRDLNTLKRVYEQPTLMGQVFPESYRRLFGQVWGERPFQRAFGVAGS